MRLAQDRRALRGEKRVAFHCWDPDGYQVEVFANRSGTEPIDS
jgi:hypothetical protein